MYKTKDNTLSKIGRHYYYGPNCSVEEPPFWYEKNWDPYRFSTVRSWRGIKDKSVAREFHRVYFRMDKDIRFDVCGIGGNPIKRLHSENMMHRWMRDAGTVGGNPIMGPPDGTLFDPELEFLVHPRLIEMKAAVKAELFAKANSPAIFDLAPELMEMGESLAFIWSGLKTLLKFWTLLATAKRSIKDFESTWLAYRYGLMPLILSISDAIAAIEGKSKREKVQHFAKEEHVVKGVQFRDFDRKWEWRYGHHSIYKLRCGAAIDIRFQNDPYPLGVGLWDFLRGSWEIVPFSFVIDWFLDVGRWLDSMRETNLSIKRSYITTVLERETKVWFDDSSPHWEAALAPSVKAPTILRGYVIDREIDIAPPTSPVFNGWQISNLHTLDACALLIGLLKGLTRSK